VHPAIPLAALDLLRDHISLVSLFLHVLSASLVTVLALSGCRIGDAPALTSVLSPLVPSFPSLPQVLGFLFSPPKRSDVFDLAGWWRSYCWLPTFPPL